MLSNSCSLLYKKNFDSPWYTGRKISFPSSPFCGIKSLAGFLVTNDSPIAIGLITLQLKATLQELRFVFIIHSSLLALIKPVVSAGFSNTITVTESTFVFKITGSSPGRVPPLIPPPPLLPPPVHPEPPKSLYPRFTGSSAPSTSPGLFITFTPGKSPVEKASILLKDNNRLPINTRVTKPKIARRESLGDFIF